MKENKFFQVIINRKEIEEVFKKASSVNSFFKTKVLTPVPENRFAKNKTTKLILFMISMICTLLVPIYTYFLMEYMHFGTFESCFNFFRANSGAAWFSVLILYGIYMILWLVLKKGFMAAFIFVALCIALAVTNYFKHALTGDFVYPWDLINQTGNLGELTTFVKMGLPGKYVLYMVLGFVVILGTVIVKAEICLRFLWRAVLAVLIGVMIYFSFNTPEKTAQTLAKFDMSVTSTAEQETNHIVNGFTGGFLINTFLMNVEEPDDYLEEKIEGIMSEYSETGANESFSSPDVIVVLAESFWDAKLLNETKFSKNPTANFEAISKRENARSGYMYQTAFGGGTVRTEFEVITGLSSDYLPVGAVPWQYVNEKTPSYATSYKKMGYRTVFMHTYLPSFYLRDETYPYLGFDEMYFQEKLTDIKEIPWYQSGKYISDSSFVSYVEYLLEKEDKPCFLFGISMENHQPYEDKYDVTEIKAENENLSPQMLSVVENYATGVYFSDMALKNLVDYVDSREKDTVVVWFGDHLPSLGADKGAYRQSGYISKGDMTDKDVVKLMKTPYLIYANFSIKEDKMGKGEEISSYNLLNKTADLIGAPKTKYMNFLADFYNEMPYYNKRVKGKTTKEQEVFINSHKLITYDILNGERYSIK